MLDVAPEELVTRQPETVISEKSESSIESIAPEKVEMAKVAVSRLEETGQGLLVSVKGITPDTPPSHLMDAMLASERLSDFPPHVIMDFVNRTLEESVHYCDENGTSSFRMKVYLVHDQGGIPIKPHDLVAGADIEMIHADGTAVLLQQGLPKWAMEYNMTGGSTSFSPISMDVYDRIKQEASHRPALLIEKSFPAQGQDAFGADLDTGAELGVMFEAFMGGELPSPEALQTALDADLITPEAAELFEAMAEFETLMQLPAAERPTDFEAQLGALQQQIDTLMNDASTLGLPEIMLQAMQTHFEAALDMASTMGIEIATPAELDGDSPALAGEALEDIAEAADSELETALEGDALESTEVDAALDGEAAEIAMDGDALEAPTMDAEAATPVIAAELMEIIEALADLQGAELADLPPEMQSLLAQIDEVMNLADVMEPEALHAHIAELLTNPDGSDLSQALNQIVVALNNPEVQAALPAEIAQQVQAFTADHPEIAQTVIRHETVVHLQSALESVEPGSPEAQALQTAIEQVMQGTELSALEPAVLDIALQQLEGPAAEAMQQVIAASVSVEAAASLQQLVQQTSPEMAQATVETLTEELGSVEAAVEALANDSMASPEAVIEALDNIGDLSAAQIDAVAETMGVEPMQVALMAENLQPAQIEAVMQAPQMIEAQMGALDAAGIDVGAVLDTLQNNGTTSLETVAALSDLQSQLTDLPPASDLSALQQTLEQASGAQMEIIAKEAGIAVAELKEIAGDISALQDKLAEAKAVERKGLEANTAETQEIKARIKHDTAAPPVQHGSKAANAPSKPQAVKFDAQKTSALIKDLKDMPDGKMKADAIKSVEKAVTQQIKDSIKAVKSPQDLAAVQKEIKDLPKSMQDKIMTKELKAQITQAQTQQVALNSSDSPSPDAEVVMSSAEIADAAAPATANINGVPIKFDTPEGHDVDNPPETEPGTEEEPDLPEDKLKEEGKDPEKDKPDPNKPDPTLKDEFRIVCKDCEDKNCHECGVANVNTDSLFSKTGTPPHSSNDNKPLEQKFNKACGEDCTKGHDCNNCSMGSINTDNLFAASLG